MSDTRPNQTSKFRTKNWIEVNVDSRRTHNINSQIKFKTAMLMSSLCDYSNAYILVKRTITVPKTTAEGAAPNNTDKNEIFKKLWAIYLLNRQNKQYTST